MYCTDEFTVPLCGHKLDFPSWCQGTGRDLFTRLSLLKYKVSINKDKNDEEE